MSGQSDHDSLEPLAKGAPLSQKLVFLHGFLRKRFPFIDHISVAVHDPQTDILKTFLDSSDRQPALTHYQARLADAPTLQDLARTGRSRVLDDLGAFAGSRKEHSKRILAAGYQSSYTLPMLLDEEFFGFVFFDSRRVGAFRPETLAHLDPFARLLSLIVISEVRAIRTLSAATKTVRYMTSRRDSETGTHLERMSRYCRLIARDLAPRRGLSDEYIEHLFLFTPLHDIGKIAIPDHILLKPAALTPEEYEIMKTHTGKGLEIVDYLLKEFGFIRLAYADVARHIVLYHHEAFDGSGYPQGLTGEAIPLEARVATVADVFDALTSRRPHKPAWSNDRAFAELHQLAGTKLDPECVAILSSHRPEVEEIQQQFQESLYG